MADTKPVGSNTYLTDLDVRIWLRDNDPEANLLLNDFEFTPEEIRTCMTLAVDHWNEQPPFISNYDYDEFPFRSQLLKGTVANLMFAAGYRFRRNALKMQSGGLAGDDQDKSQEYDQVGNRLWQEYHNWCLRSKTSINMERGWATL